MGIPALIGSALGSIASKNLSTVPSETIDAIRVATGIDGDLVRYGRQSRVEPIALIDSRTLTIPFIKDVVSTANSLFIMFYHGAVSMDNEIGNVRIRERLGKFSTDTSVAGVSAALLSQQEGVQFSEETMLERTTTQEYGLPALESLGQDFADANPKGSSTAKAKDVRQAISELSNLAVGTVIDLDIIVGEQKHTVPITFRLHPLGISPDNVKAMLDFSTYDGSARNRWRQFRAGEIKFWADLVFASDRVSAYFKASAADKSGYFKNTADRSFGALLKALLTGKTSVGAASSILILDSQTYQEFKRDTQVDLDHYETRERFFDLSKMMIMMVVDAEWEQMDLYVRSVPQVRQYSKSDISRPAKSDNLDIKSMLEAFTKGQLPGRF